MPISSPCRRTCVIDAASGLCRGCGRTTAEIADWLRMSEARRRVLMAGLPRRMARAFGPQALKEH